MPSNACTSTVNLASRRSRYLPREPRRRSWVSSVDWSTPPRPVRNICCAPLGVERVPIVCYRAKLEAERSIGRWAAGVWSI
jgi:hypothetical protein